MIMTKLAKKPKVTTDLDQEDNTVHRPEGTEYHGEVLDWQAKIKSKDKENSNFTITCRCCGYERSGSAGSFLSHCVRPECSLSAVPRDQRTALEPDIKKMATQRAEKYARSSDKANWARETSQEKTTARVNVGHWIENTSRRRLDLQQKVSRCLLACNLSVTMVENRFFCDLLVDVSGNTITDEDIEAALERKAITDCMDEIAKETSANSENSWRSYALTFGGTVIVDGWTALRCVGEIGISVGCLAVSHVIPLPLIGTTKSRPADYAEKLESVIPWAKVNFFCTDGASNMVALSSLVEEKHHVLPVMCAAHSFSLLVHYIGKVFEQRSKMFTKVAGIISFFARSPRRMSTLQKYWGQDIQNFGFVGFCKTLMAYQTLPLLRVLRLRLAAKLAMVEMEAGLEEDDESVDTFSKLLNVKDSLFDNNLFKDIEIFCRVTFPLLLAMREIDKGLPMAGFVYWLFYQIEVQVDMVMEKVCAASPIYKKLRNDISSTIKCVWNKRHRPALSFAYLTNPLFHRDLAREENIYELDENFASDVETTLLTMLKKKYKGVTKTDDEEIVDEDFIIKEAVKVKAQLNDYLRASSFTKIAAAQVNYTLAADFWKSSTVASKFPDLAWCARRAHAMSVVTSRLELFFSRVSNVQTSNCANLDAKRAAVFAAAQQALCSQRREMTGSEIQGDLVTLVKRFEDLQTVKLSIEFEKSDGFADVEDWVTKVRSQGLELLYRPTADAFRDEEADPAGSNDVSQGGRGTSMTTTSVAAEEPALISDEMDVDFENRDASPAGPTRTRRRPSKVNSCASSSA